LNGCNTNTKENLGWVKFAKQNVKAGLKNQDVNVSTNLLALDGENLGMACSELVGSGTANLS
jgi:hypothetical protein